MDLDSDSDIDPVNLPSSVLLRKGNCLIWIKTSLLQTPTRLFQKSRDTGKLYMASGPSWGGPIHRTWIRHLLQMITSSRHPNNNLWAGLVSSCPLTNGYVGKWINLMLPKWKGTCQRASETGGLQKEQFVKVSKSQSKWYGLHPSTDKTADTVSWGYESVKLNSSYSRIACSSGLSTPTPASDPLSQDTLRRWEKLAHESSYIGKQAASFSCRLSKVQTRMQTQLRKILKSKKVKSPKESLQKRPAVPRMSYSIF